MVDKTAPEGTECYICFTVMVEPVVLPCKHSFCIQCLREFFAHKRQCPMCRMDIPDKLDLKVDLNQQKIIKKQRPRSFDGHRGEL